MESEEGCEVREVAVVTRQARSSFLGAILICGFLALYVTYVRDAPLGRLSSVHAVFGALLLWALAAAAHAFHAILRAYSGLDDKLDMLAARDHQRARRVVSRIRERLESTDRSMRRLIEQSQD